MTTSISQEVYRHVPSERLSPVGNLIETALNDVPKLPAYFDRNNSELKGLSEMRGKNIDKGKK